MIQFLVSERDPILTEVKIFEVEEATESQLRHLTDVVIMKIPKNI